MRKKVEYNDRDFVISIAGSVNDRGRLIGTGFDLNGTSWLMVQRVDYTVFCAPEVQMSRVFKADCFDGYTETIRNVSHAEGKHQVLELRNNGKIK